MSTDETMKQIRERWTVDAIEDNPVRAQTVIHALTMIVEKLRKEAAPTVYSNWLSEKRGW